MPRGRKTALTVRLTPAERQALLAWQRSPTLPVGLVRRGRIILLVSEGTSITEIAQTVGISRRFIDKWVQRFLAEGLEGLADHVLFWVDMPLIRTPPIRVEPCDTTGL